MAWSKIATIFLLSVNVTFCNSFTANNMKRSNVWGPRRTLHDTSTKMATTNGLENHVKTIDILSLDSIRSSLIRQEETIIFALIERSQFLMNKVVYEKGSFGKFPEQKDPNEDLSFLEYMLIGTEALHSTVRRYTSPEEHAFFPERLPDGCLQNLPDLEYPKDLLSSEGGANTVNFNSILLKRYITEIVPSISKDGDDEQHGSTVIADLAVLQALSRRVHYGKFVAESKYRDNPEAYQALVEAGDVEGVWNLLTNMEVEKKVLRRARLKAATYGTDPLLSSLPQVKGGDNTSIVAAAAAAAVVAAIEAMGEEKEKEMGKIDPNVIESIYRDVIIPLTKDVEVAYLFLRCGRQPPQILSPNEESNLLSVH